MAQLLLKRDKNLVRSVSCTTRKPRRGEKNGRDYFFLTPAKFRSMASKGEFLEWAQVHQNSYGTPRRWVEEQLGKGKDVLFVIDVQGGKAIKKQDPRALLVFLRPPSMSVLKSRLLGRKSENEAALRIRLKDAAWEMKQGRRYDYKVVNDRLAKAVSQVAKILGKERKTKRLEGGE